MLLRKGAGHPPESYFRAHKIESGDAALAYTIVGLQRRTLGAMLGNALDRQAWDDSSASSLWLTTTVRQALRQQDTGQLDQAGQIYRQALAYLRDSTSRRSLPAITKSADIGR
jgi:hypothetical protein